ncbi:MAG: succinate dehydrogenase cytochrome b subunit [Ekhidna sp.]|nr:succinate dehydrogenase cytochrome b subunit [Ekhidna sp.]
MNSLIVKKYIVGFTGLFLCIFLIVHLSANLILLLPEELASETYNAYAAFLAGNPLIKIVAYLLYASILLHVVYAVLITLKNKTAKGITYAVNRSDENSSWASQNMGLLGVFILLFIVVHLANFWARAKLGIGESVPLDDYGNKDLYSLADLLFNNPYYVAFYTLLMIPMGYHLFHGLKSAFKSLGVYHRSGLSVLQKVSLLFAIIMTIGFGIIPIIMYFK